MFDVTKRSYPAFTAIRLSSFRDTLSSLLGDFGTGFVGRLELRCISPTYDPGLADRLPPDL